MKHDRNPINLWLREKDGERRRGGGSPAVCRISCDVVYYNLMWITAWDVPRLLNDAAGDLSQWWAQYVYNDSSDTLKVHAISKF